VPGMILDLEFAGKVYIALTALALAIAAGTVAWLAAPLFRRRKPLNVVVAPPEPELGDDVIAMVREWEKQRGGSDG
jgi:hypothetical protein